MRPAHGKWARNAPKTPAKGASSRHCGHLSTPNHGRRSFVQTFLRRELSLVESALASGAIVITRPAPPPLAHLSDDAIRERYPRRTSETKRRERSDCALLQTRDREWAWIKPLLEYVEAAPADAFETVVLTGMIQERSAEIGRQPRDLYNALHRVLALACGKNSLLPATPKCGGAGKQREPQKSDRLGRKNGAFLDGLIPSPGIHLSEIDKQRLALGWSAFLKEGRSVQEAWLLTCGAWWADGAQIGDGQELPRLLPAHLRPTLAHFRYWGPRDECGKSAFELLLRQSEWEKRYRPKLGTVFDGLVGVGQMGILDATSTDQAIVSLTSRLKALGACHRIMVHEGMSDVICGVYCGLEAPSGRTAQMAVLNAAMNKVGYFGRFGVAITNEQVPAVQFRKLLADNGELRNKGSIHAMTSVNSAIEFVERRRSERKGPVEGGHHSIHRLVDNKGDGWTHGRQRERGENHSAIAACWTWFEYMRELLRAIVYYNCHHDATDFMSRHPFRTEMRRDGVAPNRAAIYAWCVKNNRISSPAMDIDLLRAKLLPEMNAVVRQNGVFLLRPDRGLKNEVVLGHRFSGPRAMELNWHRGGVKSFVVKVRVDPDNLERIWYLDELGIHPLTNLSNDILLLREGTMHDSLAMQDEQNVARIVDKSVQDQAASDLLFGILDVNLRARAAKRDEINSLGRKVTKTELRSNISENRAEEAGLIGKLIDPIDRAPRLVPGNELTEAKQEADRGTLLSTENVTTVGKVDTALSAFRRARAQR